MIRGETEIQYGKNRGHLIGDVTVVTFLWNSILIQNIAIAIVEFLTFALLLTYYFCSYRSLSNGLFWSFMSTKYYQFVCSRPSTYMFVLLMCPFVRVNN